MATVEALMTAEEFGRMSDNGLRTELVRGRIIEVPPTNFLHGYLCVEISSLLRMWVTEHNLGRVIGNDSGIVTQRNPDSLRGADVAYYSYQRLPKGTLPQPYPGVAPELVIEVKSPSDRWPDIYAKVAEYLSIGVLVVCVIDPEPQTARLYYPDQAELILGPGDDLTFPECLPGFAIRIGRLFE
jgi:Uma2 family endonuclease